MVNTRRDCTSGLNSYRRSRPRVAKLVAYRTRTQEITSSIPGSAIFSED